MNKWLNKIECILLNVCYCGTSKLITKRPNIISFHNRIQHEIEKVGKLLINECKTSLMKSKEIDNLRK